MLAHAIEDADFAGLDPGRLHRRMEMGRHPRAGGVAAATSAANAARLYSRTGEDITRSFPDLLPSLHLPGAIDGELLVLRDGRVQTFNVLQQRLNRKVVTPKLMKEFPIHLRAYDLLGDERTICASCRSPSAARSSRPSSGSSTTRASTCRRRSPSIAGTR